MEYFQTEFFALYQVFAQKLLENFTNNYEEMACNTELNMKLR